MRNASEIMIEKRNKKLGVTFEVLDQLLTKYPQTTGCIEENMRKMYKREKITIERVFYFVVFCLDDGWLCVMFA